MFEHDNEIRKPALLLIVIITLCCHMQQTTNALPQFQQQRPQPPQQQQQQSQRHNDHNARTIYFYNSPPNERGNFHYEFQTTNGITIKSAGNEFGFSGVVQYVSIEGLPITMTYVADANGYQPIGDHIPKIPEHVRKSLEYIRTHPAVDERKSRRL